MHSRFGFSDLRVFGLLLGMLLAAGGCRPAPGAGARLQVRAPQEDRDADVYVDGNYVGQVSALDDPEGAPLILAPGVHRVEIRKPGRFPVQKTVRVEKAQPVTVVIEAELLTDPQ